MNIIFQINGGIGKTILATAVCKAIKKKHPNDNLFVISGYPEVFLNNPNVYRAYGFGQASYFYSDVIENKDVVIYAHDPYLDTRFVKQDVHLIKIWCDMFGLEYENQQPEIFLTEREKDFNRAKFNSEKPILLMQTNGGGNGQALKYSWARDIPSKVVIKVVEEFSKEYNIVHVKREDQYGFQGTTPVTDNFRAICTLISLSKKRLFMDSFAQHAAASMNLSSSVLWIANTPKVFGYDIHDNILANPFTKQPELKNSYFQKFDIVGDPLQFPYESEDEIFDADKIIASLNK